MYVHEAQHEYTNKEARHCSNRALKSTLVPTQWMAYSHVTGTIWNYRTPCSNTQITWLPNSRWAVDQWETLHNSQGVHLWPTHHMKAMNKLIFPPLDTSQGLIPKADRYMPYSQAIMRRCHTYVPMTFKRWKVCPPPFPLALLPGCGHFAPNLHQQFFKQTQITQVHCSSFKPVHLNWHTCMCFIDLHTCSLHWVSHITYVRTYGHTYVRTYM